MIVRSLLAVYPCLQVCELGVGPVAYEGSPWHGEQGMPEDSRTMNGFFVARPFLEPAAVPACEHIEVMHQLNRAWTAGEAGMRITPRKPLPMRQRERPLYTDRSGGRCLVVL